MDEDDDWRGYEPFSELRQARIRFWSDWCCDLAVTLLLTLTGLILLFISR